MLVQLSPMRNFFVKPAIGDCLFEFDNAFEKPFRVRELHPLIVRQSSTDAFGDMRSSRPEHFTVRSGSRPVTEYPRSGILFHRKLRGAPVLMLKTLWGSKSENARFPGDGRSKK